jgi:hypothetical protein
MAYGRGANVAFYQRIAMNSLDQLSSQMVALPTGVVLLGALLFLVLGLALIAAGLRTWFVLRRLKRSSRPGGKVITAEFRRINEEEKKAPLHRDLKKTS